MRMIFTTALATLGACSASAASLQTFDVPSEGQGVATCGWAIANDGTVAANPAELIGQPLQGNLSFTWHKGIFTFPRPTLPNGLVSFDGINSQGTIAGTDLVFTQASPGVQAQGFTYAAGKTSMLAISGAFTQAATGINDAGDVVGYYQTSSAGPTIGFEQVGSRIYTLDAGTGTTMPIAVDSAGNVIAGILRKTTNNGTSYVGFLYKNHQFTTIAYPGATNTFVFGLVHPNVVTGTYTVGSSTHGFIYRRGMYSPIDVRGASQTQVGGANELGQFTGCYTDKTGTHGFVYSPH